MTNKSPNDNITSKTKLEKNTIDLGVQMVVKKPKKITCFTVIKTDWERIKRLVSEISPNNMFWGNIGWACIGGFISVLASAFSTEQPHCVRLTMVLIAAFLLFLGIICCVVQRKNNKDILKQSVIVIKEMETVENEYL